MGSTHEARAVCSLPCGGGPGRGVVALRETRPLTATPTPNPSTTVVRGAHRGRGPSVPLRAGTHWTSVCNDQGIGAPLRRVKGRRLLLGRARFVMACNTARGPQ